MSMDRQALRGHLLVLLATISGIVGTGLVFSGIMHGSMIGISQGMPLVMIGLWWAGRELGRSMLASRTRSRVPARGCQNEARCQRASGTAKADPRPGTRTWARDLVLAPRRRSTVRRPAGRRIE
jgi:hypothetical protein